MLKSSVEWVRPNEAILATVPAIKVKSPLQMITNVMLATKSSMIKSAYRSFLESKKA